MAKNGTLGQVCPSVEGLSDIYKVPSTSAYSYLKNMLVCNIGTVSAKFRIAVRPNSEGINKKHWIYYDVEVPESETFMADIEFNISSSTIVSVISSTGFLSFTLSGQEV